MHVIEGIVEVGDRRGRSLGFPTANIHVTGSTDSSGAWAGLVEMGAGDLAVAAVSVGRRQTFYAKGGQRLLEAHLLDAAVDLYGRRLHVHLLKHLRRQEIFPTVDAHAERLRLDVQRTREWALGHYPWLIAETSQNSLAGARA